MKHEKVYWVPDSIEILSSNSALEHRKVFPLKLGSEEISNLRASLPAI